MDWKKFHNPPSPYREIPFWSWNDRLDPQELVRQVGEMARGGWGGFFMHARVGLRTPYMGPQWLECIRVCVEAARAQGMGAWLYDEDKWPSGFAGGLAVAAHPEYRAQALFCKVDNRPAYLAERIASFGAHEVDGVLADFHADPQPALRSDADRLVQFYVQTMPLGDAWFNDYAYLDLLNPQAVQAFLESTHGVYARAFGEEFGQAIPGVFTDEPCFLFHGRRWTGEQPAVPWTTGFAEYFRTQAGYDPLPYLPSLFFDTGEYMHVRYDYWQTVTRRFIESYSQPYMEWCVRHNLAYTGHYMAEDNLFDQIRWIGAAMPHYFYMHIPGIDKLDREIDGRCGAVLTAKQVDSVACQAGKVRTLCENYGCAGQDFAHTGRKWIGDWAYLLGINLNNPHLALYSMRGERKRDYPANLFFQQPWWPENSLVADYFARLSYALSQGQRVVDILVIHPLGSAWANYRPECPQELAELDRALGDLGTVLLASQRDFHFADELLLGKELPGKVVRDRRGPALTIGQMSYRLVIVPPGVTLATATVRLLREFAGAGGPVLAIAPAPYLMDARPSATSPLPDGTRHVALATLAATLDELLPFDIHVPGRPAIWAHHRRSAGQDCYFLAKTDLESGGPAAVYLRGSGPLEEWDPASGERHPLPCQQRQGLIKVELDFPPAGSHLLVLYRGQPPAESRPVTPAKGPAIPLENSWALEPAGPNALTLDRARVRLGAGEWGPPLDILAAHDLVARAGQGTAFELAIDFQVEGVLPAPLYLVLESPERYSITINEQGPGSEDSGWWIDPSFRQIDISDTVRTGANEIVLAGRFARDSEIESVYLVGPFGVRGERRGPEGALTGQVFHRYGPSWAIVPLPRRTQDPGGAGGLAVDLTAQGLPFFAGRATLRQRVNLPAFSGKVVLELIGLRAALAHIWVNGQRAGTVAWAPHQVEVGTRLRPGENEIAIELVGTLRNLLGPHHTAGGDPAGVGPRTFRDREHWTDDYILVPFGFERVVLAEEAR